MPTVPAPAGLFSTMTCCFQVSLRRAARVRAMMSVMPPGGFGTTMVMGRLGNVCAVAADAVAAAATAARRLNIAIRIADMVSSDNI